jgi:LPXTG-motif cell wall-anchored protein
MKLIIATMIALATLTFGGVTNATETQTGQCTEWYSIDIIEKETRTLGRDGWTEWTDWPGAGSVTDDGRNRGPAAHNNVKPGKDGYREYRYVVVGFIDATRPVECPPETTVPPTTTPPTVPETTVPPVDTTVPVTVPPTVTEPPISEPVGTPSDGVPPVVDIGTPPVPPTAGPTLPETGSNVTWALAIIGLLMLGAGWLLFRLSRD